MRPLNRGLFSHRSADRPNMSKKRHPSWLFSILKLIKNYCPDLSYQNCNWHFSTFRGAAATWNFNFVQCVKILSDQTRGNSQSQKNLLVLYFHELWNNIWLELRVWFLLSLFTRQFEPIKSHQTQKVSLFR